MGHHADVQDALEAALLTVPERGTVHKGWPLVIDQSDVRDKFEFTVGSDVFIRTWIIQRTRRFNEYETTTETTAIDEWTLFFYYGYNETQPPPSEDEFQQFIDDAFEVLLPNLTIDDLFYTRTPLQIQNIGLKLFCGVLCHYCEVVFQGSWERTF